MKSDQDYSGPKPDHPSSKGEINMTNYQLDIITTIEHEAMKYLKRFRRIPEVIALSKAEFSAYEEERRIGRIPMIKHKGKSVILSVRRFRSS